MTIRKNPFPPIFDLCWCGCRQIVYGGRRYIKRHGMRNRPKSEEHKRKIGKGNKGKVRSEKSKLKISKANKGHSAWNKGREHLNIRGENNPAKRPEVRAKISNFWKGRPKSEEHKRKLSEINIGKIVPKEQRKRQSEKIRGDNNPNWNGGTSFKPYCYKFNKILKKQIKERDGYQCQNPNCLCTQLESLILYGKPLYVHHIHYDKENCYPDLITLCLIHNSVSNGNRKYYEQLFMEILKKRKLLNYFGDIK